MGNQGGDSLSCSQRKEKFSGLVDFARFRSCVANDSLSDHVCAVLKPTT